MHINRYLLNLLRSSSKPNQECVCVCGGVFRKIVLRQSSNRWRESFPVLKIIIQNPAFVTGRNSGTRSEIPNQFIKQVIHVYLSTYLNLLISNLLCLFISISVHIYMWDVFFLNTSAYLYNMYVYMYVCKNVHLYA